MLNKLICRLLGHKRGKRMLTPSTSDGFDMRSYQCPRCKATWTRKVKQ